MDLTSLAASIVFKRIIAGMLDYADCDVICPQTDAEMRHRVELLPCPNYKRLPYRIEKKLQDYQGYRISETWWAEYTFIKRYSCVLTSLKDLSDIVNSKEFKAAELPQIARQYESYTQMFGYAYKGLLIVPPKRHNDIKKEGEILKHCVASYAKRVATGETIILFVRKADEPDKPYFTLNIEPGNYDFVQCRGLKNCHYPNEVKTLLARWYQEKIEPLRRSQQQCLKTAS